MRILRYSSNGRDIDVASSRAYEAYLDSIRQELPAALYAILRDPLLAYQSGRTFYDSIVVSWQDASSFPDPAHSTRVCIASPNYEYEFEFVFDDPVLTAHEQNQPVSRLGELYCIEVSRGDEQGFLVNFVYMSRLELEVQARSFRFNERRISSIARQ